MAAFYYCCRPLIAPTLDKLDRNDRPQIVVLFEAYKTPSHGTNSLLGEIGKFLLDTRYKNETITTPEFPTGVESREYASDLEWVRDSGGNLILYAMDGLTEDPDGDPKRPPGLEWLGGNTDLDDDPDAADFSAKNPFVSPGKAGAQLYLGTLSDKEEDLRCGVIETEWRGRRGWESRRSEYDFGHREVARGYEHFIFVVRGKALSSRGYPEARRVAQIAYERLGGIATQRLDGSDD